MEVEAMMESYAALANSADGVYAVDLEQNIVLWNRAATSILGHAPGDVLGRKCFQIVKGRDSDACAICRHRCAAIDAAQKGGLPATLDVATRRADGGEVWLNVSSVVVPSSRTSPAVLVHMFRDVTQRLQVVNLAREIAHVVSEPNHLSPSPGATSHGGTNVTSLTARERGVLRLLAAGHATDEIATILGVSPYTVRNHITAILKKLGLHSRLEAVSHAIRHGLV